MKCQRKDSKCSGAVEQWILWQRHTPEAASVELCEFHASPILELVEISEPWSVPMRTRVPMEVTKLRKVKETEHLKKK